MHDRPAIRAERATGTPIRAIARGRGASRNAVRRALRPGSRDTYHRASEAERFELAVREVLADYPAMSVANVAVMVDWQMSRRHLSDLVARLRPLYAEAALADVDAPSIEAIAVGELQVGAVLQVGSVRWW